jgi:hypothetical protein
LKITSYQLLITFKKMRYIGGMSSARSGWWRLAWLLVWLLWVAGCSAGPQAATAPAPSPSPAVIVATRTPPAPTATTPAATAEPSATVAPASPTRAPDSTAAPTASATADPALAAIYNYLEARARADGAEVTALACQAWQGQAATEAVSFRSMQARLEGVVCTVNGVSGPYTLVGCTGKIITTYGTETREWDQSSFVYQAVAEDGEWKMCGYN